MNSLGCLGPNPLNNFMMRVQRMFLVQYNCKYSESGVFGGNCCEITWLIPTGM